MRVRRSVSVLFLLLAVFIAVALTLSAVGANDPASSRSHVMAATPQQNQTHVLYTALWRTDGRFSSKIKLTSEIPA
jgi:hypothetical protein